MGIEPNAEAPQAIEYTGFPRLPARGKSTDRGSSKGRSNVKIALGPSMRRPVSMGLRNTKLEVYLRESQKLKSFASVESNGTLPWLGSD
jgi:hypothetical protein